MTDFADPVAARAVPAANVTGPLAGAGWAGAAGAGVALGLTELFAGLMEGVPSALSSVGTYVVDWSPTFVTEPAISLFGTADKGALAIGTAVIVLLIGGLVGRLAARRPWLGVAGFGLFGLLGILAGLGQVDVNGFATVIFIALAAAAGWFVMRALLRSAARSGIHPAEQPTDGLPGDAARRRFLTGVVGAGAFAVTAGFGGRWMTLQRSEQVRSAIGLPRPRTVVDPPGPAASFGIDGVDPIVVPNSSFYRIDTALIVPRPDPETWSMRIHGLVEREVSFTLDDLLARDLHEAYVTIACVSNDVGGDLVGNAKWTGVRLTELLDEAGVQPGATQLVGRSVDGWTAGFPTELAFDGRDPMVALAMNDEMLPPDHGFPARLIVPGLYGYVSATKWLSDIELTTWEAFDAYWVPRGWSKIGPIRTQSRIDVPRDRERVDGAPAVLAGVAWAPTKGISRVEVRLNGGGWSDAEVSEPLSDDAWVQWKMALPLDPGEYLLEVRATDGQGVTQTDKISPSFPSGATGYHTITFFVA